MESSSARLPPSFPSVRLLFVAPAAGFSPSPKQEVEEEIIFLHPRFWIRVRLAYGFAGAGACGCAPFVPAARVVNTAGFADAFGAAVSPVGI